MGILLAKYHRIELLSLAVVLLLVVTACVRELDRPQNVAANTPTPVAATATPTPFSIASPTSTPSPTLILEVTSTPIPPPTATLTPMNTPTPSPTASPTLTPTATLKPTPTHTPTVTPSPDILLNVLGPANGSTVLHDSVVVYGLTSVGAAVTVNEMEASVAGDGRFQAEIELVLGNNVIEVIATDGEERQRVEVIEVVSLALPPLPLFLIVTEPQDQSIVSQNPLRLSGRTSPDAVVSVNGVSVFIDQLGIFTTNVTLESGPNIIDIVATDTKGGVQSTVIAVIYRP